MPTPSPAAAFCQPVEGKIEQSCTSLATGLHYWLYLPSPALYPPISNPPLLLYLHGFNHSGSNLNLLLGGGLPYEIENGRSLPMLVVSPQCPSGENWQTENMVSWLSKFTEEATAQFHADPQRVYLTGFSMGGDGVWAVGLAHPGQFSALAPVGSWYSNLANVCNLQDVPVWVFQGDQDEIVSKEFAQKITAALQACGGTVKLTLFPKTSHEGSRNLTYGMDELYLWLLLQARQTSS